ncbi:MAG: ABC transporter substrate-binding protein [Christensenellales bacterium]|jgi:branched-chain amino acid transport system substrate-binding protein
MKNKLIVVLLALVMALSLVTPAAMAADTIKIGGIGVLTGDNAKYGVAVKEGVDLYVKQVNAAGGLLGKQVEILWEDTQGDPAFAISAYNKLYEQDVVAILGGVLSRETDALANVTAEDGIPQVTPSATAYDVTTDRPNVFRTCFLDPFQGNAIASYMAQAGIKTVAILYDNATDYSLGLYEAFKTTAEEKGVEIVATESAAYGDKDYKTQLTTIKNANPGAVFLPYYGADAAMILAQAKEIGLDVNFYGGDGISDIVDMVTDKSLLTQLVYPDHFSAESENEKAREFIKAYEQEYGKLPTISFAATGYDAAVVLLSAIEAAGSTDKQAIVDAIKATDLVAVSGRIVFDDHNDPTSKSAYLLTFDATGEKKLLGQVDP